MRFVDESGNVLSQAEKESMDYTTGRFLQDETDPELYVWSPWATVPPREEENYPAPSQLDKVISAIGGARVERKYEPGELITVDGKLYRVKLPILVGGFITPGTNAEETDIATELSKLNLGGN